MDRIMNEGNKGKKGKITVPKIHLKFYCFKLSVPTKIILPTLCFHARISISVFLIKKTII